MTQQEGLTGKSGVLQAGATFGQQIVDMKKQHVPDPQIAATVKGPMSNALTVEGGGTQRVSHDGGISPPSLPGRASGQGMSRA